MKIPTHCDCGTELVLHCGSYTCQWLRCPNARCVWGAWDVEGGRRMHRDGHVEQATGMTERHRCIWCGVYRHPVARMVAPTTRPSV